MNATQDASNDMQNDINKKLISFNETQNELIFSTRKRSSFYYGNGNFCSLNCQTDWFNTHGDNAINHFGRVEKPIILTEENAWNRRYNYHKWHGGNVDHLSDYIEVNMVTREERDCE